MFVCYGCCFCIFVNVWVVVNAPFYSSYRWVMYFQLHGCRDEDWLSWIHVLVCLYFQCSKDELAVAFKPCRCGVNFASWRLCYVHKMSFLCYKWCPGSWWLWCAWGECGHLFYIHGVRLREAWMWISEGAILSLCLLSHSWKETGYGCTYLCLGLVGMAMGWSDGVIWMG